MLKSKQIHHFLVLLISGLLILTGCSSKKAAKSPSAQLLSEVGGQTADLVTEVQFNLHLADSVELMQYLDGNHPKVDAYTVAWDDLNDTLDIVVDYSISLIDLAETSQPSNAAAINELIDILIRFEGQLRAVPAVEVHMGSATVQSLAPAMREEKTMLKAFAVAGPVVQDYSDAIQSMTLDLDTKFDAAVLEMLDKIDQRHGKMLTFRSNLIDRQNAAIDGLQLVDKAIKGNEGAWQELLATNWNVSSALGKSAAFSPSNVRKADDILADQLRAVNDLRQQLILPYTAYTKQMTELYAIEEESGSVHALAYLLAADWAASQARLAQGDPSMFKAVTGAMWKAAQKRITG